MGIIHRAQNFPSLASYFSTLWGLELLDHDWQHSGFSDRAEIAPARDPNKRSGLFFLVLNFAILGSSKT